MSFSERRELILSKDNDSLFSVNIVKSMQSQMEMSLFFLRQVKIYLSVSFHDWGSLSLLRYIGDDLSWVVF